MDAVAVVATQVHFTRVRDLILERFPEYSLRHCWPAQGILVFTGVPGPVVDLVCGGCEAIAILCEPEHRCLPTHCHARTHAHVSP